MSLQLRDIHKHFGSVRANDGVTLEVAAGELHGLLGENGAGKSTLMKVLSGFHPADSGEVILEGRTLDLGTPDAAATAGIGMLHQDPLVFLPFTVLDNFLLASPGGFRLNRRDGARRLWEASQRYGFSFEPEALTRTLSVGERQQLEIARLLWLGARVLILDEPTTGISASQRDKLFEILRHLAAEGMIVIFVSHKLDEIEDLCDRVTVMREGQVVGTKDLPVPTGDLVEMMFGSMVIEGVRLDVGIGEPVLSLDQVALHERLVTVPALSLTVRKGEVLGLAGLEGSGQRSLLRACTGLLKPTAGTITIGDAEMSGRGYHEHQQAGVHYLPAGRLEEGLVEGLTLSEHFELIGGDTSFFVDWDGARETAAARIAENFIMGRPDSTADALSGGNQQRLLLSMMPQVESLLLMEHPTRGLDLESAEWVWSRLLDRRRDGTAIVFASADLDELLRYSDRVAVFFAGEVIDIVDSRTTTPEQLGHLIGGKEHRE